MAGQSAETGVTMGPAWLRPMMKATLAMGPPASAARIMNLTGLEPMVWTKSLNLPCLMVTMRAQMALQESLSAAAIVGRMKMSRRLVGSMVPNHSAQTPLFCATVMNAV